jgi:hypothetical protein
MTRKYIEAVHSLEMGCDSMRDYLRNTLDHCRVQVRADKKVGIGEIMVEFVDNGEVGRIGRRESHYIVDTMWKDKNYQRHVAETLARQMGLAVFIKKEGDSDKD